MDRTAKALLLFIGLGLWANVLIAWMPPVSAATQEMVFVDGFDESYLINIHNAVSSIEAAALNIAYGRCANSKIC